MEKNLKLQVENLTVSFRTNQGMVRAVRGVSFDLREGETLAIVGESGSGKSVTSRTIMGILADNGVIDGGRIMYEGQDLTKVDEEHKHEIRGKRIGMIFQDPLSSLNPIMKIGHQITEGMLLNGHHLANRKKKLTHDAKIRYTELVRLKKAVGFELKAKIKELKDNAAPAADIDAAKLKAKTERAKIAAQIPDAKTKFLAARKSANATVNAEWKAEKARIGELIEAAKAKSYPGDDKACQRARKQAVSALRETLARYKHVTKKEAYERAISIMEEVRIADPVKRFKQYPFQFSGGMRQRIVIAIALTMKPDILICDEPTTALDVTVQAQILELINRLKAERNLSVIFITHDLGVVANMADRIAVMYAGKIVEIGQSEEVFYDPKHPYTWALMSSMPDLHQKAKSKLLAIPGTPPNMLFPPKGDAFAERNQFAMKIDFEEEPPMFKVTDTHTAATWLLHPDAPKVEMPEVVRQRIQRMQEELKEVNQHE